MATTAQIIRLTGVEPRLCSNCINGFVGPTGIWCAEYREMILEESVAEACEEYER